MTTKYTVIGNYKSQSGSAKVKLFIVHFQDEKNVHIIYSPHLDLSGYGKDFESAKESFTTVFGNFIDYTINKRTLGEVLKSLGWEIRKGKIKKPKKINAPSITDIIAKNKYVSEIFDNYPTKTYHEEVGLPVFA